MDFRVISNQPIDQCCLFFDLSVGETVEGVLSIEVGQQKGFRAEAVTSEAEQGEGILLFWRQLLFGMRRRRNQVGLYDNTMDDVSCCADAVATFEDIEARTALDQDFEPRVDAFGGKPLGLWVFFLELPVQLVIDDAVVPFLFALLVRISRIVIVPVSRQSLQQSNALDLYFGLCLCILQFDLYLGVKRVHDLDALQFKIRLQAGKPSFLCEVDHVFLYDLLDLLDGWLQSRPRENNLPGFLGQRCLLIHLLKHCIVHFFFAYLDGDVVDGLGLSGQCGHISIVDYLVDLQIIGVEFDPKEVFVGIVDLLDQG